jgi:hypothetical protein
MAHCEILDMLGLLTLKPCLASGGTPAYMGLPHVLWGTVQK